MMYTYILKINLGKTQQKTNIASIVSLLRLTLRYYVFTYNPFEKSTGNHRVTRKHNHQSILQITNLNFFI